MKEGNALHAKSRPATLRVLHLPDIIASMSVSGSSCLASFETRTVAAGAPEFSTCCKNRLPWDGSAIELARKITATAKTCWQRRIVILG
jgi:hypothetical protein